MNRARRFYSEKLGLDPRGRPADCSTDATSEVTLICPLSSAGHFPMGGAPETRGTVAELKARGVVFEERDVPGWEREGIAEVSGNTEQRWQGRELPGSRTARENARNGRTIVRTTLSSLSRSEPGDWASDTTSLRHERHLEA